MWLHQEAIKIYKNSNSLNMKEESLKLNKAWYRVLWGSCIASLGITSNSVGAHVRNRIGWVFSQSDSRPTTHVYTSAMVWSVILSVTRGARPKTIPTEDDLCSWGRNVWKPWPINLKNFDFGYENKWRCFNVMKKTYFIINTIISTLITIKLVVILTSNIHIFLQIYF